jgi:hypothetical protein
MLLVHLLLRLLDCRLLVRMSCIDLVASRWLLILRVLVAARRHLSDRFVVTTADIAMTTDAKAFICLDL